MLGSLLLHGKVPVWLVLLVILVTASIVTGVFLAPNLLAPRPDFQMQPIPITQPILAGCPRYPGVPPPPCYNGGEFQIFVKSVNGFTGIVTLSAVTPKNVNASFLHGTNTPNPIVILGSNDTGFLGLFTKVVGNYTVTVTGTSGHLSHSIVASIRAQDLTFSATPDPLFVAPNSKANITVTVKGVNGLFGNLTILGGPLPEFTLYSPSANCTACSGSPPPYPLLPGGTAEVIIIVRWDTGYSGRTVNDSLVVEVPGLNGFMLHNFTIVFG